MQEGSTDGVAGGDAEDVAVASLLILLFVRVVLASKQDVSWGQSRTGPGSAAAHPRAGKD